MCSSTTGGGSAGSLSFKWLKDGRDLFSIPGAIDIHQIAGMSILALASITAGDSGEYTCIASNRAGTTSVSADMVVYGSYSCKFISLESYIRSYRSYI